MAFGLKLALPSCDKCGHQWHARYRRRKPPMFYCPQCSRRHPRWTQAEIDEATRDAKQIAEKLGWN